MPRHGDERSQRLRRCRSHHPVAQLLVDSVSAVSRVKDVHEFGEREVRVLILVATPEFGSQFTLEFAALPESLACPCT